MKKMRFILCLAALLGLLWGCATRDWGFAPLTAESVGSIPVGKTQTFTPQSSAWEHFAPVGSNERLALYYNAQTAEVAVEDRQTGTRFRTNPEGWTAGAVGSQLILTLYNGQGVQYTWNTCTQAAAFGQVAATPLPGGQGLVVQYLLGQSRIVYAAPEVIQVEAFEQGILAKLEGGANHTFVKLLYTKVELKDTDSPQTRQSLLERFPVLEKMPLYVRKGNASKLELSKLETALAGIGYTLEQKGADETACEFSAASAAAMQVQVALRYELTGDGLRVTVPLDSLAVSSGVKVTDITVLPYMGSPLQPGQGYALIPDGMGALLPFDQVRDSQYPAYEARVYGRDYANLLPDKTTEDIQLFLPVFGVHQGDGALTAVISQGDALAAIVADAPRSSGSHAYCGAKFQLLETALFSLDAKPENRVTVFQPRINESDLCIDYRLIPGSQVDIGEMVQGMAAQLESLGLLPPLRGKVGERLPLVLETVGAIDVKALILGVPSRQVRPLTTFEQSGQMARTIKEGTGADLTLVLAGALEGGVRTTRQRAWHLEGKLGGQRGFEALSTQMAASGVGLSVAYDPQYVYRDAWMDGFSTDTDTGRLLTSAIAYKPDYTLSNMHQDTQGLSAYMLRIEATSQDMMAFGTSAQAKGAAGLSFTHLARDLSSDQNRKAFAGRQQVMGQSRKAAQDMADQGLILSAKGANAYLLPSLSLVYDLPLESSAYPLFSETIPMVPMLLSGRIPYAATAFEYAADPQAYLLRLIQTGAGLQMLAFAAPGDAVKYTDFDRWYASSFEDNSARAMQTYNAALQVLAPVAGQPIIGYESQEQVTRTAYPGGAVYVNFGTQEAQWDTSSGQITIPAGQALYRQEGE